MEEVKSLRMSSYCIAVKIDNNKSLLVHGYTGAMDEVTNSVIEFLNNCSNKTLIEENLKNYLYTRGYLTEKTREEEKTYVKFLTSELHKFRCKTTNKFLFLVAYDCNFRCPYCFESDISKDGKMWSRKILSEQMIDSAYQIISTKITDTNNQITLYGGEPLLKENYNIVKYIVKKGNTYGFRFNAITNGFDIDHYSDLINKENISSLQITIDGPPMLHNKTRISKSGDPTFEKIMNNIKTCLEKEEVRIVVRMNFNLEAVAELKEVVEIFGCRGWLQNRNFVFYATPVMAQDISCSPYSERKYSTNHKLKELKTSLNRGQFSKYINAMKYDTPIFSKLILPCFDIENRIDKMCKENSLSFMKTSYCSAHTGMTIFDPYGDLYTCWELVGKANNKIGTYYPEIKYNDEIVEQWNARYVANLPDCLNCKYALFCGGGCAAQAINSTDNINNSFCDGFQLMFHDAVKNYFVNKKPNSKNLSRCDE